MVNSRPMSYGQSYSTPRYQSHFKGASGLGLLPNIPNFAQMLDLEPNDPILQDVNEGTIYGNVGGNYNTPTPADLAAGQTIPWLNQLKDNQQNLILAGGLALAAVLIIKIMK